MRRTAWEGDIKKKSGPTVKQLFSHENKNTLMRINWEEVIKINEAKDSPKFQQKLRNSKDGTLNNINNVFL
jgi:hypothetical protein